MKNLQVIKGKEIEFDCDYSEAVGYCIDSDNGILYTVGENLSVFKIDLCGNTSKPEEILHQFKYDPPISLKLTPGAIKLVEFLVECGSVLIALKTGEVIRIGVSSFSLPSEKIFSHGPSDLSSVKLSPDQDLLALADIENNIHIVTIDGKCTRSSNALTENESLHKPVGVGWGSKETQFFGLDGRPSKEEQLKDEITLEDYEIQEWKQIESSKSYQDFRNLQKLSTTLIEWRGDGQYLCTLTYLSKSGKQCLKVWNRNLELQYMSEELINIDRGILTWIPNGQYICCTQQKDNKISDIVMFEKNGMVHQRVSLPRMKSCNNIIKDLVWSPDSRILAVIVSHFYKPKIESKPVNKYILMLYTTQNFHYYLKYSATLPENLEYFLRWDPIKQNKLHLFSSRNRYTEMDCNFVVHCSSQYTTVAVVDGSKLLITPMQICNIPPPMSAIVVEFDTLIQRIGLHPTRSDSLFITTWDDKIIHTRAQPYVSPDKIANTKITFENKVASRSFENITFELFPNDLPSGKGCKDFSNEPLQHLTVINENLFIASRRVGPHSTIEFRRCTDHTKTPYTSYLLNQQITFIARQQDEEPENLIIILSNQSTALFDLKLETLQTLFKFSTTSTNAKSSYNIIDAIRLPKTLSIVSLGYDLTLRYNADIIVPNSCSSFKITENYLIFTTIDNFMHFILISDLSTEELKTSIETWCQPIENGATLITACESESRVVLQMPRGNLETLHPRILIFSSLIKLLNERRYIESITVARRHRLNMNFLADYFLNHPSGELNELNRFANDIASANPSLLNLFITELSNEDTISGRYESIIKHLPKSIVKLKKAKELEDVWKMNAVLTAINLPDEENYLQPELLRLLKLEPKQVGAALRKVHKLDKRSQSAALKFVLYFIDVDQLFLESLRTYETELSLMVASASNKDPKQYLALLNTFDQNDNPVERQYKIDIYVKDYNTALEHLLQLHDEYSGLGDESKIEELESEFISLTRDKRLFKHALAILYLDEKMKNRKLSELTWFHYGNYLFEKRYYSKAGVAYSKAAENAIIHQNPCDQYVSSSFKSFMLTNNWEECLAMLTNCCTDPKSQKELAQKIIKQLMDQRLCLEAISVEHLINDDKFVSCRSFKELVGAGRWYFADFMAGPVLNCICNECKKSTKEGKVLSIQVSVLEFASSLIENWISDFKQASGQFIRLKELLESHKDRKLRDMDSEQQFISDTISTIDGSEISSLASGPENKGTARSGASSIKTKKSSKTTKSQAAKKKRIILKPGSKHEDMALIFELKNYMVKQKSMHEDASKALLAIFNYCREEDAKFASDESLSYEYKMKTILSKTLRFCQDLSSTLWPSNSSCDQKYSLYRRFDGVLSTAEAFDNADFEVLIRPDLPNEIFL